MNKFILLRDGKGIVQLIVPPEKIQLWEELNALSLESVLDVSGKVVRRPPGNENPNMPTGEIELEVEVVESIVPSAKKLPFYLNEIKHSDAKEQLRLKHRYLDLRRSTMQKNIRFRSELVANIRYFLIQNGFLDVETPTLFRRTPGGAREFVVPTRNCGKFYSLVQSPQQFKQLLMVGGFEKYFQIAKCYRDEGARPDRQPEFTQVDIELAFTDRRKVMDLIEALIREAWPSTEKWPHLPQLQPGPFPVMTYDQVINDYGTDKPDLRFDSPIKDVTESFRRHASDKFASKLGECEMKVVSFEVAEADERPSTSKLRAMEKDIRKSLPHLDPRESLVVSNFNMISDREFSSSLTNKFSREFAYEVIRSCNLGPKSLGFFVIAKRDLALNVAGRLRLATHKMLHAGEDTARDYKFLWVQDFPMFVPRDAEESSPSSSQVAIESAHHPFTQPHPEDMGLMKSDPLAARSLHYDLVLNGWEIGGGSIRINDPELQRVVLKDILEEDVGQLGHLLEAFSYGCPPHGGIALGLDRLCAIMCGADSIRDVIAFPKGGEGRDPMSRAPANISQDDQLFYHIKIDDKNTETNRDGR